MAKRPLKLTLRIPPYEHPRNTWRNEERREALDVRREREIAKPRTGPSHDKKIPRVGFCLSPGHMLTWVERKTAGVFSNLDTCHVCSIAQFRKYRLGVRR